MSKIFCWCSLVMKSAPSKVHFFANLNLLMLFCSFQQRINCLMTLVFRGCFHRCCCWSGVGVHTWWSWCFHNGWCFPWCNFYWCFEVIANCSESLQFFFRKVFVLASSYLHFLLDLYVICLSNSFLWKLLDMVILFLVLMSDLRIYSIFYSKYLFWCYHWDCRSKAVACCYLNTIL